MTTRPTEADQGRFAQSLTVVANRLPVRRASDGGCWQVSPGGLVTALTPVLRSAGGTWVGWCGSEGEPTELPDVIDGIRLKAVPLSAEAIRNYYNGFSNGSLWPLFHDGIREPIFAHEFWVSYQEVNEQFAEAASDVTPRGGAVWVQDYHLLLVPGILSRLRPDVRIGLFIHTPVPPGRLFSTLPWRDEILASLRCVDLIGTQTEPDAAHLRESVHEQVGEPETEPQSEDMPASVSVPCRSPRIRPYPISIESASFCEAAKQAEASGEVRKLREKIGEDKVICLGVDRLDYTKGIDIRLRCLRNALEAGRIDPATMAFIQIAVPSRSGLDDYCEMSSTVDGLVGEINGSFASIGAPVVTYIKRPLPFEELVRFYRAADIMMVTAIRDGMNLVAKEYAATRYDGSGELILSEFAGVAREFESATVVNPYDDDAMIEALTAAYTNARSLHCEGRCTALHEQVMSNDVHKWSASFLDDLASEGVQDDAHMDPSIAVADGVRPSKGTGRGGMVLRAAV